MHGAKIKIAEEKLAARNGLSYIPPVYLSVTPSHVKCDILDSENDVENLSPLGYVDWYLLTISEEHKTIR